MRRSDRLALLMFVAAWAGAIAFARLVIWLVG